MINKTDKMTKMDKILFIDSKNDSSKRENANINGDSAMGKMLQIGSYYSNQYTNEKILSPIDRKSHEEGDYHIHDKDFLAIGTTTCLTGDTHITLKDEKGKIINTTLSYLDKYLTLKDNLEPEIKEISNLYILGRNGWTKLNKVMRRKLNNEDTLYYLKTKKGLGLKATNKHKIPVVRNNKEQLLHVSDIEIGDCLLQNPTIIELKNDTLNIVDELSKMEFTDLNDFVICNLKKLKEWLLLEYNVIDFNSLLKNKKDDEDILSIEDYKNLITHFEIPYKVLITLHIKSCDSENSVPILLPITNELSRLIGYVQSTGCFHYHNETNRYFMNFLEFETKSTLYIKYCLTQVFCCDTDKIFINDNNEYDVDYYYKTIDDNLIVKLLKYWSNTKDDKRHIKIPEFILKGDETLKYNFLVGLFKNIKLLHGKEKIHFSTVEKISIDDITHLYQSLNLKYIIEENSYDNYVVIEKEQCYYFANKLTQTFANTYLSDDGRISETIEYEKNEIIDKITLNEDTYVYDLETTEHWFLANNYVVHNCSQINLKKLFEHGFSTSHGFIRPPKKIGSYTALTAIALQSNQNDQHGGQSINAFDYYMEKGILYSYQKQLIQHLVLCLEYELDIEYGLDLKLLHDEEVELTEICHDEKLIEFIEKTKPTTIEENKAYWKNFTYLLEIMFEIPKSRALLITKKVQKNVIKQLDNEVFQAMEGLIHNLNTMHSRAGSQVPFTSINFGTCTSPEGRMATRNLLLAHNAGLGNKETPIFPILIFKVKEGINFNVEDKNYDLFKLACKVASRRLFPNFSFIDAPFNLQYYKEDDYNTEAAYMGCRTRTISDVHGEDVVDSKGNISFTTINLPRLGILSEKDINKFFKMLDEKIDLVIKQLLQRYELQCSLRVKNFPFLVGQGVWAGGDNLSPDDTLEDVLKHGSLSVGFIGLAETLIALTGKHHGESEQSQELGLKIIKHMRKRMDQATEKHQLNFALIATPAEGLSNRFTDLDRERFGEIQYITDKDYYTNSFHIPVDYKISIVRKIELEAPYHALTNGGHISYVELDGDVSKNPDVIESIVRVMRKNNIGYGSINFKVDNCLNCGYGGIIDDDCPVCKSRKIKRIRRVTGYLSELENFNKGKQAEEKNRTLHSLS